MFSIRSRVLVAALVVGAAVEIVPMSLQAQFAGVPRAPRRRPAAETVVASRDSTPRDTLPPTKLPDMKAWVDSATIALGAAGGSAAPVGPPVPAPDAPVGSTPRGRGADSTMRDGARAPDTATPLPSLALAGALLVGAGLFVRRRAGVRG